MRQQVMQPSSLEGLKRVKCPRRRCDGDFCDKPEALEDVLKEHDRKEHPLQTRRALLTLIPLGIAVTSLVMIIVLLTS
jgi:hypothetical protein